ncbi:DNA repair protein RadA [Phytophthora cinnamomi]|uniref:DNA repair protein RadA n=1 Tax=Phytophthora cinnamomi TaxID=4785 RepID=UPI00355996B3|nr:DNA repair protein RadA [Phytophthora cinnamomi]
MDEVLVAVESSDPVVARLMVFCGQEEVEGKLARFVRRHAAEFRGVDADGEHGHEVHELFRRYEELFEDVVATFLRQEQLTPDEFFAHCRALQRSPKHEDATVNLQLLLCALDFEAFCELMTEEAIQAQQALKAAEDMGL